MASKETYNIYHYNSGSDDISALEAILDKTYSDPRYTLLSMNDSILPSGTYIAVVHFTVSEDIAKDDEERVSANAEL